MSLGGDGGNLILDGALLPVSEQKTVFAQVKKRLQSPNVVGSDNMDVRMPPLLFLDGSLCLITLAFLLAFLPIAERYL